MGSSTKKTFRLRRFLKIPILAAQLTGTFPLHFLANGPSGFFIKFSWRNAGMIGFIFRLVYIAHTSLVFYTYSDNVQKLRKRWSQTMIFAQTTTQTAITIADFAFVTLLICRRSRFNDFLTSLEKLLEEICDKSDAIQLKKWMEETIGNYRLLLWPFGCIFLMVLIGLVTSLLFYIPWFRIIFPNWPAGPWILGLMFAYYSLSMHFRLLNILPIVALIYIFKAGFFLLKKNIQSSSESEVSWIMEKFCKLENLIQEFLVLFNFKLACGVVTILISLLTVVFNGIFILMRVARGQAEYFEDSWMHFINLVPWNISLCLVFYHLCDVSTRMTNEANKCIFEFRKCRVENLTEEEKHKLSLFYIERCTRPPKVSPARFFTLGRHLFPTVLGMMTTYVIVLYQFESDDKAEYKFGVNKNVTV